MKDYESQVGEFAKSGTEIPGKVNISILKYFWQASSLSSSKEGNISKFLRKLDVFNNFSDNELRIFSKFLHQRTLKQGEVIFRQGNLGIGFYLIYSGTLEVIIEKDQLEPQTTDYIINLEKNEYFGELALLQENSIRNATVFAKDQSVLLGLFKPDLEDMINEYPIVATKVLQSISMIIANRLFSVTQEIRQLKYKIEILERSNQEGELSAKKEV
jgi:CRP/FNR family cyclic AMP-dependent transcriptional regulator